MCNSCTGNHETSEHHHHHHEDMKVEVTQSDINFDFDSHEEFKEDLLDWLNSYYSGETTEEDFIKSTASYAVKNKKFNSEFEAESAILDFFQIKESVTIQDIIFKYLTEKAEFDSKQ